jgi:hypothetical protein
LELAAAIAYFHGARPPLRLVGGPTSRREARLGATPVDDQTSVIPPSSTSSAPVATFEAA